MKNSKKRNAAKPRTKAKAAGKVPARAVPPGWVPEADLAIDHSQLITEDDTPVDSQYNEKQMRLLTEPLHSSWRPGMPFIAMANVGLFFQVKNPAWVPDAMVAVDVDLPKNLAKKEHCSYYLWLYGKPPDVVVEVVSNRDGGELATKFEAYAHHRVPYYVVYDPEGYLSDTPLQCFTLNPAKKHPAYVPMRKFYFPFVELGMVEWKGEYEGWSENWPWIRWTDGSGQLIPTGAERAAAEAARAAAEAVRATAEAARADAAAKRADALAAKLRALGVDPDSMGK